MSVVVDTNVIAYFLLGTEKFVDEVRAFWAEVVDPIAPSSWEAELTNVLWMAARSKVLSEEEAVAKLDLVLGLGIRSVPVADLWKGALVRSIRSTISAYDTLFVELAVREGASLATFDGAVLQAFPTVARRPMDLPLGRSAPEGA
jgi:predicted nucleic acid-binding protein